MSPLVFTEIPPNMRVEDAHIDVLDQTVLPGKTAYVRVRTVAEACGVIHSLQVRGAPAIGIFAAHALALEARTQEASALDHPRWVGHVREAARLLLETRPTAVNLRGAMERMVSCAEGTVQSNGSRAELLAAEAEAIHAEDRDLCQAVSAAAQTLIPRDARMLTICHTGAIATGGIGTALGAIHLAHADGKKPVVFACETRPLLQGARLTAWELMQSGIPATLITDSMAAHIIRDERITLVIAGADRIARNGDTANKIGTFGLAVLARYFNIPFYVAAQKTTLDLTIADGSAIPIEERSMEEVTSWRGTPSAPAGTKARNPAFDVTPADLITAIITEAGVHRPPYRFS